MTRSLTGSGEGAPSNAFATPSPGSDACVNARAAWLTPDGSKTSRDLCQRLPGGSWLKFDTPVGAL
jgi:hypothetical protein